MGLAVYRKKRNLAKTPEPRPARGAGRGGERFVVQKHRASHLHYDLRLEADGVLKSWAVPKGPSLNPADKRLAMKVEDHPLEYRNFEGVIPPGNYGAGTVMIWDEGTYGVSGAAAGTRAEEALIKGLRAGVVSFFLKGKKLKGEWSLVKIKYGRSGKGTEWLFIKKADAEVGAHDVTLQATSARTGRTMEQIAADAKKLNRPFAPCAIS